MIKATQGNPRDNSIAPALEAQPEGQNEPWDQGKLTNMVTNSIF